MWRKRPRRAVLMAMLVAAGATDDGIVVVDRATLEILGTVRPEGILGAGHHIATDSQGNLYVAATGAGMQKLTFRGMSGAR